MSQVQSSDDWEPHGTYKNFVGARFVEAQDDNNDWDVGIMITRKGDDPEKENQHHNWVNGDPYFFEFIFTEATGTVEFNIEDGNNNQVASLIHVFDQYIDRGMDEIYVSARGKRDNDNIWIYSYISNLQLDGQSWDFNDIESSNIYTYATISGIDCNDFILTGDLYANWIGQLVKKNHQFTIHLGEPCDPNDDIIENPDPNEPNIPGGEPNDPNFPEPNLPPPFVPKSLPGDLTGDCSIDLVDIAFLSERWGATCDTPDWCDGCDFDQNYTVDQLDLDFLLDNWLAKWYGGGCGTQELPFLIYTAQELNTIGVHPADWGANFKVMADIDLGDHTGNSFNTIGNPLIAFTGVFDGNDHEISFFTQGDANEILLGLFRYIAGPNTVIKNVKLKNPNVISESSDFIGALIGWASDGQVSNCQIDGGRVMGYEGLVLTTGANYVGGLIGYNLGADISNSSSNCSVYGYDKVGGLVGENNGSITQSYTEGNGIEIRLPGVSIDLGVKAWTEVGGLVGRNNNSGTISDSFSKKAVWGNRYIGGLIGRTYTGPVGNCYSTGYVPDNSEDRGGVIGFCEGPLPVACFWDIDTCGPLNDNGIGTPKSTVEMQTAITFTSAGWDFSTPVWTVYEAYDYPVLWWVVAPDPDPMTWASEPNAINSYTITMSATTATAYDGNGVEYYFNNVTDPCLDSGWQDSPNYINAVFFADTQYTYQVKVRDKSIGQNESSYSIQASATTPPDFDPPQTDPPTWAINPVATDESTITMTANTAIDGGGVEYYFANLTDTNHFSGWQDSPTYVDTGLQELTQYSYQMMARDKSVNLNQTQWSTVESAFTQDITPPTPAQMTWAVLPTDTGAHTITMTATTASDSSGVQYYFANVTDPAHDSEWQDSATYTDNNLQEVTQYTYKVKARDKSSNYNENQYSTEESDTTSLDTTPPSPGTMTWTYEPNEVSPFSIVMTATTASDISGVEYYFECTSGNDCHDSNWQDNTFYMDTALTPDTLYSYRVKARDKSINQNETLYSIEASETTRPLAAPVFEQWNFRSQGAFDGRVWNNGPGTNGLGSNDYDIDDAALRLGDFGLNEYRTILSFDTSFLPEDCTINVVILTLTRGGVNGRAGDDPFLFNSPGSNNCYIDIVNSSFGNDPNLLASDFQAAATVDNTAWFYGPDPGENGQLVSSSFNAAGRNAININGITQLRVHFSTESDGDGAADYLGFYPGDSVYGDLRPTLVISYTTRTPYAEFTSIAAEDGLVWDTGGGGVGVGSDYDDNGDIALRIGDSANTEGYRNILSFDTSSLPDFGTILSANLEITRGRQVGFPVDPFDIFGNCIVDISSPYFGSSSSLENQDWQDASGAADIARFVERDPGQNQPMLSTPFNAAGLSNISTTGKTQLRFYFETSTDFDATAEFYGFYSSEWITGYQRPRLLIRYTDY